MARRRAPGSCSTASSTRRSPTRAPGAASGIDAVAALNAFATGGLAPDRTLLLRVDPAIARARQQGRDDVPDRLEREADAFFATIAAAYDDLAARDPRRIRVLDAAQSEESLLSEALEALADLDSPRS